MGVVSVTVCEGLPETVPMVCLLGRSRGAFIRRSRHRSSHILALFGKQNCMSLCHESLSDHSIRFHRAKKYLSYYCIIIWVTIVLLLS